MAEKAKRNRAANFTAEEKLLCLNIIKKYKKTIECKETGAITWQEKESVWKKIEEEYNSESPGDTFRTMENLKSFYNNKKKEVRKIAAKENNYLRATGGSPSVSMTSDPTFDITLDILNKKTVFGLDNKFDGDSSCLNQPKNIMHMEEIDEEENALNRGQNTSEITYEDKSPDFSQQETNGVMETTENENCGNYTPQMLKRKKNPCLQSTSNTRTQKWSSRQKPQASSSTENVALNYEKVADVKLDIEKMQLELLKAQKVNDDLDVQRKIETYEIKKERDLEEFQLRKKLLLLDAEIKETQLKALHRFQQNSTV